MHHAHPASPPRPSSHGFTLIELLIALAIAAILLAVALPSFQDAMRKSRRSDAFTALSAMQNAQERWRGNNAAYTTTLSNLGLSSSTTSSGYYTLSVASPTGNAADLATGYVVTAEGVSGTSQGSDAQCRMLSVRMTGGNLTYASCGSCSSFTYSGTDSCWRR